MNLALSVTDPTTQLSRWAAPPGRGLTAALVASLMMMLWAASSPGPDLLLLFGGMVFAVAFLQWLMGLVGWLMSSDRVRGRYWLATGAMLVGAIALYATTTPLQLRFGLARNRFDAMVQGLEPEGSYGDWIEFSPGRAGSYSIHTAYQVGDNVIIVERPYGFFSAAGFAYLPDGPDQPLDRGPLLNPYFRHLSGEWYSWVDASKEIPEG